MTKKHVNLLFLLLLCNVASMRADFGFGFVSKLFGLTKNMFWINNSFDLAENINPAQKKPYKGLLKRGWKWITSNFGFITSEHVEKLGTRVNNIETKVNNMVQNNNEKLDQLEAGSKNIQTEVAKNRELVEQFRTKYLRNNINLEINQYGIKKEISKSAEDVERKINGDHDEIIKKFAENGKTLSVKIDQIDKQRKELEETLRASTVRVSVLFQALQKLTALFYQARESCEQRENDLLLGFHNLSTDEFKQFKELKFGAYSGSVAAKKMPVLEFFKNEETRSISLRERCLMAYAVHACTQYQKNAFNAFKDFDDDLD